MCYYLYLASPLTLSEVRSMLPTRLRADLATSQTSQVLKSIDPTAQTVIRILAGQCSCDLIRPRLADQREDERHLRERYRRLKVPRPVMIEAFERHRRGLVPLLDAESTPRVLAAFVAEHARNAGTSLYYLRFSAEEGSIPQVAATRRTTVPQVAATPGSWLVEETPIFVSRS
jgi:hypothetical protein